MEMIVEGGGNSGGVTVCWRGTSLRPPGSFETGYAVYRGLRILDPTRRKVLGSSFPQFVSVLW